MPLGDRIVLAQPIWKVSHKEVLAMGPRIERAVQNELFLLGKEARDLARRICPVDTGAMRASIYVTRGVTPKPTSYSPYVQQSSNAYFKAANAASDLSGNRGRKKPRLVLKGPPKVDLKTQTPMAGSGLPKPVWEKIVGHENGEVYKVYAKPSMITGVTQSQSIMEMGVAKRTNFWVTLGASAFYAGYVEFGHVTAGGGYVMEKPFMRPAMEWARKELPERMLRAFAKGAGQGQP